MRIEILLCEPSSSSKTTKNKIQIELIQSFASTECHFGKELKELGSTWFPDLGAPFGKMYCIKCECVPVSTAREIDGAYFLLGFCNITPKNKYLRT